VPNVDVDIAFWAARWKEGKIGFHEGHVNGFLEKHIDRFERPRRVLVPLCGKAEDMAFLAARGHEVIGVEAVEDAVTAFFREHDLEPEIRDGERVRSYAAGGVTILAGDFYQCSPADVGAVDAVYDRAALVALPAPERPRYVAHIRSLVAAGSPGIVITFDFLEERFNPPPFAVSEREVRELFAGARVEAIGEGPLELPRLRELGITAKEQCFAVTL
jgi:thiopurine S-methyltransferase